MSKTGDADGAKSPWAEIIGRCYTVGSFGRVTGLSSASVADAADKLRVLRVRAKDDIGLFPAFQVRGGRVCPDLRPVLTTLQNGVGDPWTWALWLRAEIRGEPSCMSRPWVGDLDGVLREARHDEWAWRS